MSRDLVVRENWDYPVPDHADQPPLPSATRSSASARPATDGGKHAAWRDAQSHSNERDAKPTFTREELALVNSGDVAASDADIDAELDAEDLRTEKAMLAAGMSREEIAKLRGRPVDEIGRSRRPTLQSVERELAEIAEFRRKDRRAYFSDEQTQAKERKLIEALQQLKTDPAPTDQETDEQGDAPALDPALLEEWERTGGVEHHLQVARKTVQAMRDSMEEEERQQFEESFDALPQGAQTQVYRFIAIDGGNWPAAKDAAMEEFGSIPEQAELVAEWGAKAARKVGTIRGRIGLMLRSMSEADRKAADDWIETWSPAQAKAVLRALAG